MMAAAMAVAGAASAHPGHNGDSSHEGEAAKPDAKIKKKLAEVRRATARYQDVDKALKDGYVASEHCVEVPEQGGMGYHYVNPKLASDTGINPKKPEMLLYAPGEKDGELELVGVEYWVADADQRPDTNEDRPYLFGKVPFDGPMPGHEPGMPMHYDLHVWLFEHNPAGIFAPVNPGVSC